MKQILVATDLSERSDRAVERAILLTRQFGARLTVLRVIDEDLPASVADRQKQAAETALRRHLSSMPKARALDIDAATDFGKDWKGILQRADAERAGLIVLGLHRERGIDGMFRGTTVERVARNSDAPVLVVKNRPATDYGKVVVGVDFSVYSRRAAAFALHFAPGAKLALVHAYDIPFKRYLTGSDMHAELKKRDATHFSQMVGREMAAFLTGLEIGAERVQKVMREGGPREVIQHQVAELGAGLLVVGTHGRTGVARALLGSIAEAFLIDPPCDVVAVKAW